MRNLETDSVVLCIQRGKEAGTRLRMRGYDREFSCCCLIGRVMCSFEILDVYLENYYLRIYDLKYKLSFNKKKRW